MLGPHAMDQWSLWEGMISFSYMHLHEHRHKTHTEFASILE